MSNNNNFFSKNIGSIILIIGLIFSAISIDYQNSVTILIGATAILWGGILLYIKDESYTKTQILENTGKDLYSILNTLYKELSITGKPVYYFEGSLEGLNQVHVKLQTSTDDIITLIAPGQNLHRTLETALDENFSLTDIFSNSRKLEKTIIGDYNLASSVRLQKNNEDNVVHITIVDNIFTRDINSEEEIWKKVGDPLTSALACIITRSTGKKLIIENFTVEKRDTEIVFTLLDE